MRKYEHREKGEDLMIFPPPTTDRKIHVFVDSAKNRIISRTLPRSENKIIKNMPQPLEELNLSFRLRQKFQQLYKTIKKNAHAEKEELKGKKQKRYIMAPNDDLTVKKPIHYLEGIKNELNRIKSKSMWEHSSEKGESDEKNLQICTVSGVQKSEAKQEVNIRMMKSTRYHKPVLSPIRKQDMSNNIKDYLSVERIKGRDADIPEITRHNKPFTKSKQLVKNETEVLKEKKLKETKTMKEIVSTKYQKKFVQNHKFIPPFETYYYRDVIWRVAYSNGHLVKSPMDYEHKIKIFIGKGNNSRLVKSITNRRPWYQITEKLEDANVIWTQLKVPSIYSLQECEKKEIRKIEETGGYIDNSIWSEREEKVFKAYFSSFCNGEERMDESFKFRNKTFKGSVKQMPRVKIHNHLINSYLIGNKKALFKTMSGYYTTKGENVFDYLPVTFHISNGLEDEQFEKFCQYFQQEERLNEESQKIKYNTWIIKPGENTNRGQGINICFNLQAIQNIVKNKGKHHDGSEKTYILQKYIERPFLYKRRKFDLRHFIMVNCSNSMIKGYWFKHGYVRTCSTQYSLKQGSCNIHLTNDSVQKQLSEYGKYQKGNKLSYDELSEYMSKLNKNNDFWGKVYPKMKKIATDVMKASVHNLDPVRRKNNFQIFGLDFMIDENLQVWLIQVNTNPCLEISCPLLMKIIPPLIEHTFEIAIDPIYPPPVNFSPKGLIFKGNCLQEMKYELVYDERWQAKSNSGADLLNDQRLMKQEEVVFEDEGEDWIDI